jgi:hypothetical protein
MNTDIPAEQKQVLDLLLFDQAMSQQASLLLHALAAAPLNSIISLLIRPALHPTQTRKKKKNRKPES